MKLKLLLVAALAVIHLTVAAPSNNLEEEWKAFKLKHTKQYRSLLEEENRKGIFADNLHLITEHNKLYAEGLVTYSMGIHQYSDMTPEQMRKTLNGFKGSPSVRSEFEEIPFVPDVNCLLPSEVDWREEGAVTQVKDQGYCGSCWAFSAVGAIEGQYFLKTGQLASLSEQNIVDCSKQQENQGCVGGDMIPAFEYVYVNDGIDSESSYPYEARDNVCRYDVSANVTSLRAYRSIERGNEDYLKAAVATFGPVSVAIDADTISFLYYSSGVHYNAGCRNGMIDPESELNHGVLVVGYGTEDGMDYWWVKNSWGDSWGDNGYIKMARNKDNNCGIAALASLPVMY